MAISLLGPLEVDGHPGLSPRDRVVLAALAVHAGDVLSAEQLADALWGEDPPPSWPKVVQGSVSRLRRTLGHSAVETTTGGYRLTLGDDEIDVLRFERLVARGRTLAATGEPTRAAAVLEQALALWRGRPLVDLERWPAGQNEASRLDELRRSAQEDHARALIAAGHDVVPAATALVAEEPLREGRWALLATALYRAGRQSEALAALRRARTALQDQLGLDPGEELVALERAILTHDPALERARPTGPADSGRCPYKGLLVYDSDDASTFFGRDAEVARCLRELRRTRFLVLGGPSGSGKSSLVRAGLVPALAAAGRTVTVTTPGTDPMSSLVVASSSAAVGGVIVVDQLEELFGAGHRHDVAAAYVDQLDHLAERGHDVVLVVRADHLGGFASSTAITRRVEQGLALIGPMTEPELRAAIEGPAAQAGLRLEPGLTELLLRDVEGEPGALPLLSHALAETWERREGNVLTVEGYRATGGIRGAVAQSAELLFASLPTGRQAGMRALLMRLVSVSTTGAPVVARVPIAVLAADAERAALLDLLTRARLVTTDETTATVAHEAVLRAWPRLRTWLDEDAAGQRTLRHLGQAAEDWQARGRPDSELYRGARLEAATEWRRTRAPELTPVERDFLDAASALRAADRREAEARVRQQAASTRRLRLALAGTAAALVLAVAAGGVAVERRGEAAATARTAQVERLVAQSVTLRATQRDLAALLALEAYRIEPGPLTRGAVLGVFTGTPGFLGYRRTDVPLTSGRVLPGGRLLLAVGTDGVVRLLDLRTGRTTRRFPAPAIAPDDARIALSADGATAAEISWAGPRPRGGRATLGVYDVASGSRRLADTRLPMDPGAVAVSPDGRFVAVSGYDDGRAFIFDTAGVDRLPELLNVDDRAPGVRGLPTVGSAPPPFTGVRHTAGLAFMADGTLVVGSEVGVVRLVDPETGAVRRRLTGAEPLTSNNVVAISPDGTVLVTAGTRAVVRWDLRTGRPAWTAALTEERCQSLAVSVRTGTVLCGGRFARVVALDLRTGRATGASYDMQQGAVSDLALTADGRRLVQLSGTTNVVARWRLDGTGPLNRLLPLRGTPVAYNADGSLLLASGPGVRVDRTGRSLPLMAVLDARSGEVVTRLGPDEATPIWTGRRSELAIWTEAGAGYLIDARTHRRNGRLDTGFGEPPIDGRVAADGRRLLAWGSAEGSESFSTWEVWDLRTGRVVGTRRVAGHSGSFAPHGRLLMWADGADLTTYDLSGRRLATRPDVVHSAASPTGLVAASTADGGLGFYRPRDLAPVGRPLPGTPGHAQQLAFSGDGSVLAAHSGDGGVRVFDVPARLALGEPIDLGSDYARTVALRPDGRELALPHPDGILMWDLRPSAGRRAACSLAGRGLTADEMSTYLSGVPGAGTACTSAS